jgi:hypothetical protein
LNWKASFSLIKFVIKWPSSSSKANNTVFQGPAKQLFLWVKIFLIYRVCHGFRLTKRIAIFESILNSFKLSIVGAVLKIGSSLKQNHHQEISLPKSVKRSVYAPYYMMSVFLHSGTTAIKSVSFYLDSSSNWPIHLFYS